MVTFELHSETYGIVLCISADRGTYFRLVVSHFDVPLSVLNFHCFETEAGRIVLGTTLRPPLARSLGLKPLNKSLQI
jgi:hypothetical protein